ncbi:hypothetical protein LNKW23_21000 [Paralimibaculum aggregatum]|uniref:Nickel/cobalt transporter regulator n=1 Tax=Paralimibaculum aggregatum TaxID=3036245 RepID=A0ABQ6LIT7_9RHOB|nr:hypothetical protein [Limibaculum sp. NKW23]GMG82887.1 hypothetical protein LNKW23_21000 [Limibaculum sp. NKW23]
MPHRRLGYVLAVALVPLVCAGGPAWPSEAGGGAGQREAEARAPVGAPRAPVERGRADAGHDAGGPKPGQPGPRLGDRDGGHGGGRDRGRRRPRRGYYLYDPYGYYGDDRARLRLREAAPEANEAAPAASPRPAGPPDPAAPGMRLLPRGAVSREPALRVGSVLPAAMPHVTLDWRTYGLPRPPEGMIYARVQRRILLLDPATRRVLGHYDPAAAGGD